MKLKFNTKNKGSRSIKINSDFIKSTRKSLSKTKKGFWGKHPGFKKKFVKVLLVIFGVFIFVAFAGGIILFSELQKMNNEIPTPDKVFPTVPLASEIFDRLAADGGSGTRLYRVFNEYNSDKVNIVEIPEHVKWTFLAAEDVDFYNHGGFDLAAIIRCGFSYIKSSEVTCGGSTITQQLTKITALKDEVGLTRKIKELLLSIKVEQSSTKDEILEMYLRVTPFGSNIYGIKTAANFYYGKEPKDLTLAEATVLAGIIQNPSRLSPTLGVDQEEVFCRVKDGFIQDSENYAELTDFSSITDPHGNEVIKAQRYKCRQLYILGQIEEKIQKINDQTRINKNDPALEDVFTPDIIEQARREELKFREPIATDKKAGHFVDYVLGELQTRNYYKGERPFELSELQTGGFRIYTTMDYGLQQIAEGYANIGGENYKGYYMHNVAFMTTTPSNGQIITMAGSKSYYGTKEGCDANEENCLYDPQVNILTSLQSPGSTNKPMGYYLAFKEGKLFPGSLLPDIPVSITDPNGTAYEPRNWDSQFKGLNYSVRNALRDSRNIPAVAVVENVGINNYVENAKKFGYTTYTSTYGPAVILGGVDIKPLEHVQAFGIFANNGDLVRLDPILKITDNDGNLIYEASPAPEKVADEQAVYLLNQTLSNLDGFSWDGREISAKTGTSQENKDSWFSVWSPDFVTVAWGGNNNNVPIDQYSGWSINVIQPWLKDYMRDIGESPYFNAKRAFTRPGFVYQGGGGCTDNKCLGIASDWLIQDRTPPHDRERVTVRVCKDQRTRIARPIDELVGMAEDAVFDKYIAQPASWQQFIDKYLMNAYNSNKDANVPNGGPIEPCTIDRTGGATGPFFASLSASLNGSNINIKGGAFSTTGIVTSVGFTLGGITIPACAPAAASFQSFDITCDISGMALSSGSSNLVGIVDNDLGDSNSRIVVVDIPSGLSFSSAPPTSLEHGVNVGLLCSSGTCQYDFRISYSQFWSISGIQLWVVKNGGSQLLLKNFIGVNDFYRWGSTVTDPGAGAQDTYTFFITASTSTGGNLRSPNHITVVQ